MHELSLAAGILDIVRQHVQVSQAGRVRAVRVRVGEAAGVVPDSLDFCFDAIVIDTPFAAAFLEIDHVAGDVLQVVDVELDDAMEATA
ncbi:MAG: hypothetical protein A3J29_06615 [Acidobacteria bacterium RIFCSPLOWO2_12_FULL_67_14b]|nr:MAG: hypothetical protein A3J29_06615 [Acidobacteria bacterium RIFCSPLOWO2_12_FULL_67_14b]